LTDPKALQNNLYWHPAEVFILARTGSGGSYAISGENADGPFTPELTRPMASGDRRYDLLPYSGFHVLCSVDPREVEFKAPSSNP
jgi:hypothetical protein